MMTIDLRSDTVTHPTPEMRQAMFEAEVGDDVLGDDPTVQRLEAMAAERMGKEAAVYVSSGTMGNLLAVLSWCNRGDEVILGSEAHILWHESAGSAAVAGTLLRAVPNDERGRLDPDDIAHAVRAYRSGVSPTGLVALENTHNRCSGAALSPADTRAVAAVAHEHGLPLHLDGARIFNAAVAQEIPADILAGHADSVTFCFSKGLSAPIGSALCGPEDFIGRARKWRKMLGGGMRQVGVIAAAAMVSLETMVPRLAEDHQNAKQLAKGLAGHPRHRHRPGAHRDQHRHLRVAGRSARGLYEETGRGRCARLLLRAHPRCAWSPTTASTGKTSKRRLTRYAPLPRRRRGCQTRRRNHPLGRSSAKWAGGLLLLDSRRNCGDGLRPRGRRYRRAHDGGVAAGHLR